MQTTIKNTPILKTLSASLVLILTAASLGCKVSGGNMQQGNSTRNPPPSHLYGVMINDKYGFIDQVGNLKFTLPDDVYTVGPFSEGLAVVARQVPSTLGRWGYVDETGKFVIEARFNLAKPFSEGLAAVIIREEERTGGKVGYIDRSGRMVIQPQFAEAGVSNFSFSEGLAPVALPGRGGEKWGYIDKSGKFVIGPQFAFAFPFSEGRALVFVARQDYSGGNKWGFIDKQGRWIVQPQDGSASHFSEGLAPVVIGDKTGFIDTQGEIFIKPQFDSHGGCRDEGIASSRFSEGLAAVQVKGNWGFINRTGEWVIKPAYACAMPFSQGLALIGVRNEQGNWRFGYIDKTGAVVVEPQFGKARSFVGPLALVTIGMTEDEAFIKALEAQKAGKPTAEIEKELESHKDKYGYIDKSGKFIWKPPNHE